MLVKHHVGVERHTDGHDDAHEPGERQRGAEQRDDDPQQRTRQGQADKRHDPQQAVVGDEVQRHDAQSHQPGDDHCTKRALTEGGGDGLGGAGTQLQRQGAVAKGRRHVLGLLLGEAARDADLVLVELGLVDRRCGQHLAVQHDGELPPCGAGRRVLRVGRAQRIAVVTQGGGLVEQVDAVLAALKRWTDLPLALLVKPGAGSRQRTAGEQLRAQLVLLLAVLVGQRDFFLGLAAERIGIGELGGVGLLELIELGKPRVVDVDARLVEGFGVVVVGPAAGEVVVGVSWTGTNGERWVPPKP